MAGERLLPRADSGCRSRRGLAARDRAESALADLHRHDCRACTRARRRDDDHARIVARRRAAHQTVAGDRRGDRSGTDRASRPAALALRRTDRHRGCAPRRVQPVGHSVGQPLGRGPSLRVARAEPSRRAGALPTAGRRPRDADRHGRARGGLGALQRAGQRGGFLRRGDLGVRRGAGAARRAARRRGGPSLRRITGGRAHALPSRARAR